MMSAAGDACDNAMVESFFAALETELVSPRRIHREHTGGCVNHVFH